MDYIRLAKAMGFDEANTMKVSDFITNPEFRKACEQNICGNYNLAWGCPPKCGTVDEMVAKMNRYETALVLQTKTRYKNLLDIEEQVGIQRKQNKLTEVLADLMRKDGVEDLILMSSGPWKKNSCLSAYCIDCSRMAETVGMECWKEDGHIRYFTLILY